MPMPSPSFSEDPIAALHALIDFQAHVIEGDFVISSTSRLELPALSALRGIRPPLAHWYMAIRQRDGT